MEALQQWAGLAAVLISIGTAVYSWMTAGSKANEKRLTNVEERLTLHADRIGAVENELRHMPDAESTHRLEIAIAKLDGRLQTLDERLKPVAAISERMQELMLEQAKK